MNATQSTKKHVSNQNNKSLAFSQFCIPSDNFELEGNVEQQMIVTSTNEIAHAPNLKYAKNRASQREVLENV